MKPKLKSLIKQARKDAKRILNHPPLSVIRMVRVTHFIKWRKGGFESRESVAVDRYVAKAIVDHCIDQNCDEIVIRREVKEVKFP